MANRERPGALPGRPAEPPDAGEEVPAAHDLKRAREVPQGIRERIREVDVREDARGVVRGDVRGLRDAGDLEGPRGGDQESRGRGSDQG